MSYVEGTLDIWSFVTKNVIPKKDILLLQKAIKNPGNMRSLTENNEGKGKN